MVFQLSALAVWQLEVLENEVERRLLDQQTLVLKTCQQRVAD